MADMDADATKKAIAQDHQEIDEDNAAGIIEEENTAQPEDSVDVTDGQQNNVGEADGQIQEENGDHHSGEETKVAQSENQEQPEAEDSVAAGEAERNVDAIKV